MSESTNSKTKSSNPDRVICQAIKRAEADLRLNYPILNNQDAIGFFIFIGSLIVIALHWIYYFKYSETLTYLHIALIIVGVGYFTSFLHELEHDLIHNLYFKNYPIIQDIMFFFIWIAKLHGNPWYRREMHLKHHIVSGQIDDAEERLIGLGLPFGLLRLAVSTHPFGALIITKEVSKDAKWLDIQRMNLSSAPVAFSFFGLNKLFILYGIFMLIFGNDYSIYLPIKHWYWIKGVNILICLPNIMRHACIAIMSNCSHYYGDIPEKSVFYQNQILDHWILFPFQFFCVNFGMFIIYNIIIIIIIIILNVYDMN